MLSEKAEVDKTNRKEERKQKVGYMKRKRQEVLEPGSAEAVRKRQKRGKKEELKGGKQ
jgi:hypothetical protein